MNDVVPPRVPEEMPEEADAETNRRPDSSAAGARVERSAGGDGHRLERCAGSLLRRPLPSGQVGHLVLVVKALAERSVPSLGAPDGMGV